MKVDEETAEAGEGGSRGLDSLPALHRALCQTNAMLRFQFDQRLSACRDKAVAQAHVAQINTLVSYCISIACVITLGIYCCYRSYTPGLLTAILLLFALTVFIAYLAYRLPQRYRTAYQAAVARMQQGGSAALFAAEGLHRIAHERLERWLPLIITQQVGAASFEREMEYCACLLDYIEQLAGPGRSRRWLWLHTVQGQLDHAVFYLQWMLAASTSWYFVLVPVAIILPPVPLLVVFSVDVLGPRYITSRARLAAFIDYIMEQTERVAEPSSH